MSQKIVWIGTYANDKYFSELKSGEYVQFAANRVQGYYLKTLSNIPEIDLDIWSALVTVPHSISKILKLKSREDKLDKNTVIRNVGFLNIKYISILSQTIALKKLFHEYERTHDLNNTTIIVYSLRIPYLKVANKIKSKYKNVKIINIVPDLPEYMSTERSLLRSILINYNKFVLARECKKVDGFVLYAEPMARALGIDSNSRYIVIEGLIENTNKLPIVRKHNETKICLYAGGVYSKYGAKSMVEGFIQANLHDVELHIYGLGDYVEELKEVEKKYCNIQYKGCLSPDKVYEKMQMADLLINPRPSDEEYTKYSCPSKIFEYMLSGTPVVMTKLEGIPSEYFKYVYTICESSPEEIANFLKMFFRIPENIRLQKAKEAREFLLKNKNADRQVNTLLTFADSL